LSLANQAANDIRNFVNKLQPLFSAAEALEKIGNIEQLEREATERKANAERELEKILPKLKLRQGELQDLLDRASESEGHAEQVVAEAENKVGAIIERANKKAASIVDEAKKNGAGIDQKINERRAVLSSVEKEIEEKSVRLESIKKEIAAAKSKISEMMRM
jgi:chromosome segregation ATPase